MCNHQTCTITKKNFISLVILRVNGYVLWITSDIMRGCEVN